MCLEWPRVPRMALFYLEWHCVPIMALCAQNGLVCLEWPCVQQIDRERGKSSNVDIYGMFGYSLLVGLILTLIFLGLEFICFLSGISMFMPIQGLICILSFVTRHGAVVFQILKAVNAEGKL